MIPWHRTRSGRLEQLTGRLITAPGVQNVVVRAGTARRPDAEAVEFGVYDGAASARDHGHPRPVRQAGCRKEAAVTSYGYEITVLGSPGPATREAFADMAVEAESAITVLSGDFDQHVLDRVRALGLELVEIKQSAPD